MGASQKRPYIGRIVAVVLLVLPGPARAWLAGGHERITDLAVTVVAERLPSFFAEGRLQIIHNCVDPDLFCDRAQVAALASAEGPQHYLDWELLQGRALPAKRSDYLALCRELNVEPGKVGTLPYALIEWTEALTMAFAEHRRWPENPRIAAKVLVYAGWLAHYAGDASQPLHLTIHYDGRVGADGVSPTNGIHLKVDALAEKLPDAQAALVEGVRAQAFENPMQGILAQLRESHELVDPVYAFAGIVPALPDPLPDDQALRDFLRARVHAGASLLASLYVTAWERSATLVLPAWHTRDEGRFGPAGEHWGAAEPEVSRGGAEDAE